MVELFHPLGVNSSLTISALAFRIAEDMVSLSNLPVESVTIGTKQYTFLDDSFK